MFRQIKYERWCFTINFSKTEYLPIEENDAGNLETDSKNIKYVKLLNIWRLHIQQILGKKQIYILQVKKKGSRVNKTTDNIFK